MSDIAEIRKKLGVTFLDKETRERLLEEFKKAGGVVIDDNNRPFIVDKEKQAEWIKTLESRGNRDIIRSSHRDDDLWKYAPIDLWVYLFALFNGVITFSGKYINNRFLLFFQKRIIPSLRHSNVIILNIFRVNSDNNQKIQIEVTKKSEIYFDLLEKFSDLYNEGEYKIISNPINKDHRIYIKSHVLKNDIKRLMKKLYILKPYEKELLEAIKISLEYQDIVTNSHNAISFFISMERYVRLVFKSLFKKVFLLFQIITEHKYSLSSGELDEVLEIKPEDKIGYFKPDDILEKINTVEKGSDEDKKETNDKDLESEELTENIKNGIKIISKIVFNDWVVYLTDLNHKYVNFKDKVFIMFILFKEFESEYSFILSSSRININVVYENGAKIDYKDKLNNLYVQMEHIGNSFAEYFKLMYDINNLHAIDEIEKYSKMESLENRRNELFISIYNSFFKFFSELKDIMKAFIDDISDSISIRKIIENPDEKIIFDVNLEGNKKMNGLLLKDIIKIIFYFISGILYELSDDGILTGDYIELEKEYLELLEERKNLYFKTDSENNENNQLINNLEDLIN